jgi:CheY-like chemotaxis protein
MVVDDDYEVREMLSMSLRDEGYVVTTAENGERALHWLRQTHALPRVILLDLMMPVMTGWEFRVEQQSDPRLASIPVVMLSARPSLQHETYAISADDFLQKPINVDSLLALIERYA